MGNVVFYKDINDTFECDIKVEGTSLSESKARLLMKFKSRSYIFEGSISKDGHVKVNIPVLSEVQDDAGDATLEIIAESTFFEAWKSPFTFTKKKNVQVEGVQISTTKDKVVIENVSAKKEKVKREPEKENSIYKENCSEKNKKFIRETFDGFKSLPKKEKSFLKKQLREFKAPAIIRKWGESVFVDPDSLPAKLCMLRVQSGKK